MGNLSNLYISQSFTSLAHLGTNNALVPGTMTRLEDGIGQSLNISFDGTNISSSGNIFAANITASVINTGSLVSTSSFNAYTQSTNVRLTNIESTTASLLVETQNLELFSASALSSISQLNASSASQQVSINALNTFTASQSTASIVTSITNLNNFTSSANSRLNNIETTTASLLIETSNLETFSASALVSISNLNQSSASQQVSIDALNVFTASQSTASIVTSITNLNQFTQSAGISISALNAATSSYVTESETASFARTNVDNNFTANQTFTNITAVSASFTYVQTTYETASVIYSSGSNQFGDELSDIQTLSGSVKVQGSLTVNGTPVLTSSVDISGLVTTASFNAYTQSNDQKVSSLETNSASVNISISALNQFTASQSTASLVTSITELNTFSASAKISINALNSATASYVTETESGSFLLTASFDNGTRNLTFTKGNNTTFAVNIPDVSGSAGDFVTTSSFNAYTQSTDNRLTNIESTTASLLIETQNLELFSASALVSLTNINSATSSLFTSASLGLTTASISGQTLTFTKGDGSTFGILIPDVSGSTINTGSFATTGSNSFRGVENIGDIPGTSNGEVYLLGRSGSLILGNSTATPTYAALEHLSSSQINANTNLIFKDNTLTGSTIISGSGNIFSNPTDAAAGRVNYIGGTSNLFLNGQADNLPQITSSAASVSGNRPTMNGNIINGSQTWTINQAVNPGAHTYAANVLIGPGAWTFNTTGNTGQVSVNNNLGLSSTMTLNSPSRSIAEINAGASGSNALQISNNTIAGILNYNGPVSSSNHLIATTAIAGNLILNMQSQSRALSMTTNIINGIMTVNDNTVFAPTLGSTNTIQQNNINGTFTLNQRASCSINLVANNINTWTLSNDFNANSITPAATRLLVLNGNILFGSGSNVYASGSNGSQTFSRGFNNNLFGGLNISASVVANGGNSNMISTIGVGQSLHVVGTSRRDPSNNAGAAETQGSAFFGRFNKEGEGFNTTAEVILAIGTGTSGSAGIVRKTGFLIDSGSNTFIEGTLNVSGATSLNGNLVITGSLTASLQQGFVYVGNASGITTTVSTSSFGTTLPSGLLSSSVTNFVDYSTSVDSRINGIVTGTGFATTGSNTFTGDQTLIDNVGNSVTLTDASGSLMLVAKGFTSSSLHLTGSASNQVNLIFKSNNNTGDTIISGSNNIFQNPIAPSTGFKRYLGSNNIAIGVGFPQISGSMGFLPFVNDNYLNAAITMRGPVSSSIWTIAANNILGAVSFGTGTVTNFEKAQSGLTFSQNLINGNANFIASREIISESITIAQNSFNAFNSFSINSSSLSVSENQFINTSITNDYHSGSLGRGTAVIARNYLHNATITIRGALPVGRTNNPEIYFNLLGGNTSLLIDASTADPAGTFVLAHGLYRTIAYGDGLSITGSNFGGGGSAFFGRNNAIDGNKSKSQQTIFAVGTGANTSNRKTGFLIDSGSNSFFEGTLNVSGSTTLSGSLYIQSASAFPTQIGTSLVTWDATTGQVGQATTATLISSSFSAGEFYSMTTLSGSSGVSASINLPNTAISNGVSIQNNSQIVVQNTGTYNIQFSAQCDAFDNADTIWIWFKKNGTNIADSASKLIMQNNTAAIMTVNIFDNAVPNDYYEVVWQNNAGHGRLTSDAATGNIPGVPSVIVTVNQVK